MNQFEVDLTNCDKEPIHILGKIQAQGFLLAASIDTFLITHISENAGTFLKLPPHVFLGKHIDDIEKPLQLIISTTTLTLSQLLSLGITKSFASTNPVYITINTAPYNLIISVSGNNYLLEFEVKHNDIDFDIQKIIGRSVSEILSETAVNMLLKSAAREIKEIIGYDRVMIYKFNDDGHGEVIAEEVNNAFKPFLGLHYPASDIPRQARELYKINLTRIIADVDSECSPIICSNDETDQLDLTHSVLRAVSPIHLQYLKNMGVASSFSISLILNGELWGLVACHNYTPKFIEYKIREASRLIGQILSSALEYRIGEEDSKIFKGFNETVNKLITCLESENEFVEALTSRPVTLQDINNSTGVTLSFANEITMIGITPSIEEVIEIVEWLKKNMEETVYTSNKFSDVFEPAKNYTHLASGIMACWLSKELSELIIWFKPEQTQNVSWAGNPDKPAEKCADDSLQISPRKSFETWTNIVTATSEKWSRAEIATAVNIREQIMYWIKRKSDETRILNDRLKLAYEEIDTFNFTVSHDLRTPLTAVKSYTELLLAASENLDENARQMLNRINVCADKMALLIKEILNYSGIGKDNISPVSINMASLIKSIKADIFESMAPVNIEFTIGETPDITGDFVMMEQVFMNLIGNAVKYSSKVASPKVKVEGIVRNNEIIYSIADNGIGIDVKYYDSVFELFKRMDNVTGFEGSGVGLAIVKRIIIRHNARIWFESVLGKGTVFYVAFQQQAAT